MSKEEAQKVEHSRRRLGVSAAVGGHPLRKAAATASAVLTFMLTTGTWLGARTVVQVDRPDLLGVSPVTDTILMLHFREGHIDYFQPPDDRYDGNSLYYGLLDLGRAVKTDSYEVSSSDDPEYASPRRPVRVGRKSKGFHFHNLYTPGEPPHLSDHRIYIELPLPLQRGRHYTVSLPGLAYNRATYPFLFDERILRSETVHVNQVGYRPEGKKYAYLSHFMGDFHSEAHQDGGLNLDGYDGRMCRVIRADTLEEIYAVPLSKQQPKTSPDSSRNEYGPNRNFTNADVWQCDFSPVTQEGYYVVAVDGVGRSFPFNIAEDVYRAAFYTAMRGLFFQRQGVDRIVSEFDDRVYPADYQGNRMYYLPQPPSREHISEVKDTSRPVEGIWGWYHDAGDWDTYAWVHADVPAMLLLLYELAPEKFGDGDVGNIWRRERDGVWIDEGCNGIPDLLDEAAWYIRFLRRSRTALRNSGHGTGGVPAYVGIDAGHPDKAKNASWLDDRDLAVTKEDPGVTALYAGLAAWLGTIYQELDLDSEEPQEWIREARSAYNWAKDHQAPAEELAFGAVGLYRATGEPSYQTDYRSNYSFSGEYWAGPEWPQLAACLYALLDDSQLDLDREFQDQVHTAISSAAVQYWAEPGLKRGYRATHIAPNQANMLGTFSTPRTLMQAVAYRLTGEQRYHDAVQFAADYTLGGNPMNLVWMSGLGHRPEIQPFHIDSWSLLHLDSQVYIDPILPGLVPYGTHKTGDWFGPSWKWIGDEDYSRSTAYPVIWRKDGDPGDHSIFPAAEARFHNRHNISASEFTVHQNQIHAAFTYGFLSGSYRGGFHPNKRPWVRFALQESSVSVVSGQELSLRVRTSADTRRVEYYLDWHLIAESSSRERFQCRWKIQLPTGTYSLTAVAYDDQGLMSLPSIEAGLTLKVEEKAPEEPHEVRAVAGDGKAYLNWTAAPRALSYRVKQAVSVDGPFEPAGITNRPDFVDGPLVNGRTYYYVVSASNPHGESPDSPPVAVTPRPLSRRPLRAQRPESRTGPEVSPRNL